MSVKVKGRPFSKSSRSVGSSRSLNPRSLSDDGSRTNLSVSGRSPISMPDVQVSSVVLNLQAFKIFVENLGGSVDWIDNIPKRLKQIEEEIHSVERKKEKLREEFEKKIRELDDRVQKLMEERETILRFCKLLGLKI